MVELTPMEAAPSAPEPTPESSLSGSAPSVPAAAAPTPPNFSDVYGDKPWAQNFAKSDDPWGNLAKSYESAQEMIGRKANAVEVPGEGAAPEAVAAFRKALGIPDTVDGYEYQKKDLSQEPELVQKMWNSDYDAKLFDTVRKVAHEQGIPPKALAALAATVGDFNLSQIKAGAEAAQKAAEQENARQLDGFKKFYGEKAGNVIRIGQETLQKIGMPKEIAEIGGEAPLIWAMQFIHEKLYSNDSITTNDQGSPGVSASDLRAKIEAGINDKAYSDKLHPRHKEHFAYIQKLYAEEAALKARAR